MCVSVVHYFIDCFIKWVHQFPVVLSQVDFVQNRKIKASTSHHQNKYVHNKLATVEVHKIW